MSSRRLVALPVYNEARHVDRVLDEVRRYSRDILVVDDGSADGTSEILARRGDVRVVRHKQNRGYGAALLTAFAYAQEHDFELLVTIDCDCRCASPERRGFVQLQREARNAWPTPSNLLA